MGDTSTRAAVVVLMTLASVPAAADPAAPGLKPGARSDGAGLRLPTRAVGVELPGSLRLDLAFADVRPRYEYWRVPAAAGLGADEGERPWTADTRLTWQPRVLGGGRLEVAWVHRGGPGLQPAGDRAERRDVYHLRAQTPVTRNLEVFGSLVNLTDARPGDGVAPAAGALFAPGRPRALYLGVEARW